VNETCSDHEHSESFERAAKKFDKEENGLKVELKGAKKRENSGPRLCHREVRSTMYCTAPVLYDSLW
jgi:hypothetical protein